MAFHPNSIDHRVDTNPARHFHQRFADVRLAEIDHLSTKLFGQREAVGIMVDGDHLPGAHHDRGLDREQADGATAPDRDGIVGLDFGVFRRHPPGGQDVGKEQHLVIVKMVGDHDRADIGIGHADIFRLTAPVAAGHVRISEQRRHGVTVELGRHILLFCRIGIFAGRELLDLAMEAAAAADGEGHHDALAFLERAVAAGFDHAAHEFMAQHVAGKYAGNNPVVKVEVAAADRGGGNLDDRITRIDDFGIVDGVDPDVVRPVPSEGSHISFSCCLAARVFSLRWAEVAISPVSISPLKRLRSWRACTSGSRWNSFAMVRPRFPAGGL